MFKPSSLQSACATRGQARTVISFITLTPCWHRLGVTALITVLSVMNGFEAELRERISHDSHASITARITNCATGVAGAGFAKGKARLGLGALRRGQAMLSSEHGSAAACCGICGLRA